MIDVKLYKIQQAYSPLMKQVLLVSLLIICLFAEMTSYQELPSDCFATLVTDQTCDFYTQCLEKKYHCGPKGYPMGYGYVYCNKFTELSSFPDVN
jgi:hypothetical protein